MSTLSITYRKNPQYVDGAVNEPRLFAVIDLSGYGVTEKITDLPIYFRQLKTPVGPIRVVYSTRVAGLPLERGNLESLVTVLDGYLASLIRFERLPEYVFHVGDDAWPIYQLPGELVTRYPGGPVFSAPDIAELRLWLADHFKRIGRIENRRELNILYLSHSDLQLYPPECTLRASTVPDIPVFPTKNGKGKKLVAPVNSQSISVPMSQDTALFDLYHEVGWYLTRRGRIADPYELTVRKLDRDTWARLKAALTPYGLALSFYVETDGRLRRHESPVFTDGQSLIAAQVNRLGRMSLYLGTDMRALQKRLGEELYSYRMISSPDAVQVVSAQRDAPMSILDRLLQAPAIA
ncbi:MAG: hypothetical protein D6791_17605 [Chloroflexi bacterium]|nr:MAG: hypothetical protein D6791_17605 [Chloroflexota bacterium]